MKNNFQGTAFLSGGGDEKVSAGFDGKFVTELLSRSDNPKLLYIPLALNRDAIGFESAYDWFTGMLSRHTDQFIEVEMWTDVAGKPDSLSHFDAIYLGGGNTYKLLKWLDETGFGNELIEYYQGGGLIYGGSAGAIVMGEDIKTVENENLEIGYGSSKGLSLLSGAALICHYEPSLEESVAKSQKAIGLPVWALPEDSGLIVTKQDVLTIGKPVIFR